MAEYFSHDYDAREDEKIQNLIFKMGMEGYGIYWSIIEMLYKNDGYMQMDCKRIAFALHSDEQKINIVINEFELFKINKNIFTSPSALHRIKLRKGKSATARKAAKIRWGSENADDANALQTHSERNAKKKRKESKEIKEKEIKEKYAEFVFLKDEEYQTLINKHGEYLTKKMINMLDNYKGAKGQTYKSDYRAILSWVEDKVKSGPDYAAYMTKRRKEELKKHDNSKEPLHPNALKIGKPQGFVK